MPFDMSDSQSSARARPAVRRFSIPSLSPSTSTMKAIPHARHAGSTVLSVLAAFLLLGPVALAGDKLVIEAGRIITQAGPEITNGLVVIENGRITAVGKAEEVEKPWDAPVIGGPEWVAFPGFVEAHTFQGMDRANENIDVAPFLDIRDSVDPVAYYFEDCLRWGITTTNVQQGNNCVVGGRGMIVRPVGLTIEEMAVRPLFGIKMSAAPKGGKSRATQMQALRRAFDELRRYLEDLVQKERDERGFAEREALFQGRDLEGEKAVGRAMTGNAWTVEGLDLIPRGAIDEKQAPLLDVVEGRVPVFLYCGAPLDVPHALEVARANGFLARTTLVIDDSCWKAADAIAEAGVPVVLDGTLVHIERDPITGEEIETFVPGVLREKGIRFAISSENANTHSLWYQAALAIGLGLEREAALDAVTKVPAEVLGMGKDIGSIEVGKLGNVVLFSGDPLSVTSWVERVVIEGREVYDRTKDVRNKHLLEGVQPKGTTAPGAGAAGDHGDDHGTGEQGGKEEEPKEEGKDETDEKDEKKRFESHFLGGQTRMRGIELHGVASQAGNDEEHREDGAR
jgi:imidazolonepropionase-like amidohydrolase